MNLVFSQRILVITGSALLFTACHKPASEETSPKPEAEHSILHRSNNGEAMLHLDKKTQERMGLKTERLKTIEVNREVKAFGKALDPAPLLASANEISTAKATLTISQKEFDRAKLLHEQNNISAQVFQTAEAAVTRNQLALQTSQDNLLAAWGKHIAERKDLADFAHSLVTLQSVLARVDLPLDEHMKQPPQQARIAVVGDETNFVKATFLTEALSAHTQTQGQSFIYLISPNSLRIISGASLIAFLPELEKLRGVVVPSSGLVRHLGKAWIYQRQEEEEFVRTEVSLDQLTNEGWLVKNFTAEKPVVTAGAQQLLSEELKSAVSE